MPTSPHSGLSGGEAGCDKPPTISCAQRYFLFFASSLLIVLLLTPAALFFGYTCHFPKSDHGISVRQTELSLKKVSAKCESTPTPISLARPVLHAQFCTPSYIPPLHTPHQPFLPPPPPPPTSLDLPLYILALHTLPNHQPLSRARLSAPLLSLCDCSLPPYTTVGGWVGQQRISTRSRVGTSGPLPVWTSGQCA